VDVDFVGIEAPYTLQGREALDRALGLERPAPATPIPEVAAPAPANPPVGVGAAVSDVPGSHTDAPA
jgi:hypothetical protein